MVFGNHGAPSLLLWCEMPNTSGAVANRSFCPNAKTAAVSTAAASSVDVAAAENADNDGAEHEDDEDQCAAMGSVGC
ncbi:hypothetical protein RISK_005349 [Rhodopirellula islandica]|uniref:Uncharacterized protein n=1 Tax=Rhodopirellula islandica TaxID=595434 RepID=A0A0J1B6Q6_RHOIS|nr:hypothetical protein RISK_005349 [Rhodopirellula islandica]